MSVVTFDSDRGKLDKYNLEYVVHKRDAIDFDQKPEKIKGRGWDSCLV